MKGTLALAALSAAGAASALTIQKPGLEQTAQSKTRAAAVVTMTNNTWKAYRKYAWGYDQLEPLSLDGVQTRNGWGASIVDALDTLILMNLTTAYAEGLAWVKTIDYSHSKIDEEVSVFETTIRYLGGMNSAYYLDPDHPKIYITKGEQLGEMLSLAWQDNNDVALRFINTTTRKASTETSNIAEAGTLSLEFDTLSTLSGNTTYRTLAQLSTYGIMNENKVLPGIPAQGINTTAATPVGDYATFDGGSDSYFEYLLKYAMLTGNQDTRYLSEWKLAIDSLLSKLIHKDNVLGNTYPADYSPSNGGLIYEYSHLECFLGGNLLLGGQLLQNDTIKNVGLALTETCYNSYNSTATKIGPEVFCYIPQGKLNPVNGCNITSAADQEFYSEHGFAITAADYIHRPEVIESYFYAYRITGDTIWQDRAWEAFQAIRTWTRATVAFSAIDNVNKIPPGNDDDLESFFFAELMKYFFLIFQDGEVISLDDYVFNTECHPIPYKLQASYNLANVPSRTADFALHKGAIPAPSGLKNLLKTGVPIIAGTEFEIPGPPADADQIASSLSAKLHHETGHSKRQRAHGIH